MYSTRDRERKGADTRKSDELKMERGLNKRPDGLSETVAVMNMKRGRGGVGGGGGGGGGGTSSQTVREITFFLSITNCRGRKRGEKEQEREKRLCEVGREGRWGEAEGCVLT